MSAGIKTVRVADRTLPLRFLRLENDFHQFVVQIAMAKELAQVFNKCQGHLHFLRIEGSIAHGNPQAPATSSFVDGSQDDFWEPLAHRVGSSCER